MTSTSATATRLVGNFIDFDLHQKLSISFASPNAKRYIWDHCDLLQGNGAPLLGTRTLILNLLGCQEAFEQENAAKNLSRLGTVKMLTFDRKIFVDKSLTTSGNYTKQAFCWYVIVWLLFLLTSASHKQRYKQRYKQCSSVIFIPQHC